MAEETKEYIYKFQVYFNLSAVHAGIADLVESLNENLAAFGADETIDLWNELCDCEVRISAPQPPEKIEELRLEIKRTMEQEFPKYKIKVTKIGK